MSLTPEQIGRRILLEGSLTTGARLYTEELSKAAMGVILAPSGGIGMGQSLVMKGDFPCFRDWLDKYRKDNGFDATQPDLRPMAPVRQVIEQIAHRGLIDVLTSIKNAKYLEEKQAQNEQDELDEIEFMALSEIEIGGWG